MFNQNNSLNNHWTSSRSFRRSSPMIIKDLRDINLLNEFFPIDNHRTRVQETVEVIPHARSCERIFYSYIDDRTDTRRRTSLRYDQGVYVKSKENFINDYRRKVFQNIHYDHRLRFDFYSTTLFIFPKQRNEKFISEIRYSPEHITVKYRTNLEILARTLSSSPNHYYQNLPHSFGQSKEIFYRI